MSPPECRRLVWWNSIDFCSLRVRVHTHTHTRTRTNNYFMKAFVCNKMLNIFTLKISFPTCSDYYQTSFIWYVLKAFFSIFPPPPLSFSLKIHCIGCIGCLAKPVFWTLSRFFHNSHPCAVLRSHLQVLRYGFETTRVEKGRAELSCSMLRVETITYQSWKAHSW